MSSSKGDKQHRKTDSDDNFERQTVLYDKSMRKGDMHHDKKQDKDKKREDDNLVKSKEIMMNTHRAAVARRKDPQNWGKDERDQKDPKEKA